jgi:hypothetical protein
VVVTTEEVISGNEQANANRGCGRAMERKWLSFYACSSHQYFSANFDKPEQEEFCENLSFSPWNALEAHCPVAALNRASKFVYEASSNYRHQLNGTQVPQNLDW